MSRRDCFAEKTLKYFRCGKGRGLKSPAFFIGRYDLPIIRKDGKVFEVHCAIAGEVGIPTIEVEPVAEVEPFFCENHQIGNVNATIARQISLRKQIFSTAAGILTFIL